MSMIIVICICHLDCSKNSRVDICLKLLSNKLSACVCDCAGERLAGGH